MKHYVLAMAALVPAGTAAAQQYDFACPRLPGFEAATRRDELPAALQKELEYTAMPGERWNPTDVMGGPEPNAGLQLVWHKGTRWVTLTGIGGIATWFEARGYDVSADGKTAAKVKLDSSQADHVWDMCEIVEQYETQKGLGQ